MRRYDDIERLGKEETEGILNGECYISEKIDGANCSLYWNEEKGLTICSRNNIVYTDLDGGNFRGVKEYIDKYSNIARMIQANPDYIFYCEWLVKHSLSYPEHTANHLWFYDIYDNVNYKYLHYSKCLDIWKAFNVNYLPVLDIIQNPTVEDLQKYLNLNNLQAQPRQEGIVIKRYDFINKFGRQQWAKIVNEEFKEVNKKLFSYKSECCQSSVFLKSDKYYCMKCEKETLVNKTTHFESIEEKIAEKFVTKARIEKLLNKILDTYYPYRPQEINVHHHTFSEKDTAQVIERTFYDVINEEMYDIIKDFKYPKIDFKVLRKYIVDKTKIIFFNLLGGKYDKSN